MLSLQGHSDTRSRVARRGDCVASRPKPARLPFDGYKELRPFALALEALFGLMTYCSVTALGLSRGAMPPGPSLAGFGFVSGY